MLILEGLLCLSVCGVLLMLSVAILCIKPVAVVETRTEPLRPGAANLANLSPMASDPVGLSRGGEPVTVAPGDNTPPATTPPKPDEVDADFALGDVAALIRWLWNDQASTRARAADALGRLGSEAVAAIPALRTVALRDTSELVRKSAAYALLLIQPGEYRGSPR